MRRSRIISWPLLTLAIVVALGVMLVWPSPTMACDLRDISCHGHNLTYNTQKTAATTMWIIVRGLLMLSRIVEGLRVWLVEQVLREVLVKVLKGLEGVFVLSVLVAVLLLWFSFFVQSLVSLNWVDTRRALRNGFFAVMIFLYGGQLAAGFEQARVLGGSFVSDLARTAVVSVAGGSGVSTYSGPPSSTDVVSQPGTIYAADSCETGTARSPSAVMLNDLAANYIFASEKDVHCPVDAEGRPWLPEAFWDEGVYTVYRADGSAVTANTPGYFSVLDIGRVDDENERQRIINRAGAGVTRMSFAIPMAIMALLEQLAQLLYAICLMAVWFGIALSLILSLYLPTEGMFTHLVNDGFSVIKGSVLSSLYIAIGASVLQVIITSSNSNGLIVGLVGILDLILLIWIIKQAAALFLSTIASVGSSTAQGFGGAVVGAAAGAAAVGGVLTAQAARKNAAYQEAYESYADDYGADTKQQREAAKAYAKRKAADATRGTMTQDLMRVMRAGTDIASAARDPLGTLARVGDRMALEQQSAGIREEIRGLRQDMAGPQAGADGEEKRTDGAPLTSAQAGAAMAGGQAPQGASDGRRKLRDLVATARRDGRLGTTSSLREVDEEIERLTTMAQAGALQLDQQGGLMDEGERKRVKDRLKQLDAAIREQRELRGELAKVMARSEREARGDLSHQQRTGTMSASEASEVMRRRSQGLATAEQASDAGVILGEAARKRASAQDWRFEEGDPASDAGARQMVGQAVGGLQREIKGYQVDAERARRIGDLDGLMRAERGEAEARAAQGRYRAIGSAVRALERPGSSEEARKAAVEQLERAEKEASQDFTAAAERGSVRDMREAEQRGTIARQALNRATSPSGTEPVSAQPQSSLGSAQQGKPQTSAVVGVGTSAQPSGAAGQPAVAGSLSGAAGQPAVAGSPTNAPGSRRVSTARAAAGQAPIGPQVAAGGSGATSSQASPAAKTTVPLSSGDAASTVAPVSAAASAVPSASVADAARIASLGAPAAAPANISANSGNVAAPAAVPAAQGTPVAVVQPEAALIVTPATQTITTAAPANISAIGGNVAAPTAEPAAQIAPTATPAAQGTPVPVAVAPPQAAPTAAPAAQGWPVAAPPQASPTPHAPTIQAVPAAASETASHNSANGGIVSAPPRGPAPSKEPIGPAVAPPPPSAPAAPSVTTPVPNLSTGDRPTGAPNQPLQPTPSSSSSSATGPRVSRRVASIKRDRR